MHAYKHMHTNTHVHMRTKKVAKAPTHEHTSTLKHTQHLHTYALVLMFDTELTHSYVTAPLCRYIVALIVFTNTIVFGFTAVPFSRLHAHKHKDQLLAEQHARKFYFSNFMRLFFCFLLLFCHWPQQIISILNLFLK